MNLAMIVLFNCTFTFVVYLIMARKVSKAREREVFFEKYQERLSVFSSLVEEFVEEMALREGLNFTSINIKPSFNEIDNALMANAAIFEKSITKSLLFTIYEDYPLIDSKINSYEFVEKRTKGWKKSRRISRGYSFNDWLERNYSLTKSKYFNEISFKTLVLEVSNESSTISTLEEISRAKINKEFKEAEVYLDKMSVSKLISSIKRKSSNLIKLASDVDDIDISVSISEFDENTNAFVEFVTNEMEKDLKKANEKSNEYLRSIDSIRKSLKSFISLKEKGLLTDDKEVSIQDEVDKEISKWNKFIKEEA